jgi:hypothetical protein
LECRNSHRTVGRVHPEKNFLRVAQKLARQWRTYYEGSKEIPARTPKGGNGMPWTLEDCAAALGQTDLRFHYDEAEQAIRLVFVTSRYRNRRGEHLAMVTVTTPADGQRLRFSIERAIEVGDDPAAACLAACQFAAAMPLVGVEYDADFDNLRLVVETVIEDDLPTPFQLCTIVNRLVDAAEIWSAVGCQSERESQHSVSDQASNKVA